MKRFLLFAIAITVVNYAHSQACGTSGTSQCTASGTITQPGLSPMSDSLAPFVNHVNSTTVIQFRNLDIVYYNNFPFTLQ